VTTLKDRPNTALLVIDVQNGVVENAHDRDGVIANINTLVEKARSEDVPVIWIQHSSEELPIDSEQWRYVAELERIESEPLVAKLYGDSFEDTGLEDLLAQRGVGRIVITGAQTDACIRSTMHGGFTRGYDVTLVADATRPKTSASMARRRPTRSSRTRISIGSIKRRRGVEAEQSPRPTSSFTSTPKCDVPTRLFSR